MKYRIKGYRTKSAKIKKGRFAALRKCRTPSILPPSARARAERISLDLLFEISSLPEVSRRIRLKAKIKSIRLKADRMGRAVRYRLLKIRTYFKERRAKKSKKPPRLAFFFGVGCSAALCAVLGVCVVLLSLFGRFLLPYTLLRTPDLVGTDFSAVEAELSEKYNILLSYENSDTVAAGHIISQAPSAGVGRKIYKNRPLATLTLKVSMGKSFYTVENFVGKDSRTSLLSLYNSGVAVKYITEYSDSIPKGTVISTSPAVGAKLFSDEVLTVRVSLGKKNVSVTVPDLYGLGEAQALSILQARGLTLGKITYKPSNLPAGCVIEQSFAPYSSLSKGSAVDISVSMGASHQKSVPDLYGLDLNEAALRLYEVGLVVGSVFSVTSGAPVGTVISQSYAPGTPITSSLTSVDIYISS